MALAKLIRAPFRYRPWRGTHLRLIVDDIKGCARRTERDHETHLRAAIASLAATFGVLRLSPVYRSRPVGFDGDDFLNMVIGVDTDMSLAQVVAELARVEAGHGRERGSERFASRTLDLDLLLYGDEQITEAGVTVPRDEILKYAFVLKPLADLASDLRHPGADRSMGELWAGFDDAEQTLEPFELRLVDSP